MVSIPIDKVPLDAQIIREQIAERRQAIQRCIGWLYPSVLASEIEKLQEMLKTVEPGA